MEQSNSLELSKSVKRSEISCTDCAARCCRLEVLILTDTGVPEEFIEVDEWGGMTMDRLDDGWCAALNRGNMNCSIYPNRPLICREFAVASDECLIEREGSSRHY